MLCHPAVVASHGRGDPQSIGLLTQERISAVARAVGPDFVGLREVRDVLFIVAGPSAVFLAGLQGSADRVNGRDPLLTFVDQIHGRSAHASHDPHVHDNIRRVGDLDAQLRDGSTNRAHRERDHVHGATLHGTIELLVKDFFHFLRVRPVVCGSSVLFLFGADERTRLNAGHVRRLGARKERVGTLLIVQTSEHACFDHEVGQAIPFFFGTIDKLNFFGFCQSGNPAHPLDNTFGSAGRGGLADIGFSNGH